MGTRRFYFCQRHNTTRPANQRRTMGKKSKRRGGGTSDGARGRTKARCGTIGGDANAGTLALAPAGGAGTRKASKSETEEALALLESVRPLDSLKGVDSTNEDPNKCAWCDGKIVFSTESHSSFHMVCCGKRSCKSCCEKITSNSCETHVSAADLLGERRCVFCNVLKRETNATLMGEAKSGKSWAQYLVACICLGPEKRRFGTPENAFTWLKKAAAQNHPESIHRLAWMYMDGEGNCPRDLAIARAYARKVGVVHADMRLLCSQTLINIAEAYLSDGDEDEAVAVLEDVVRDADDVGLDLDCCKRVDWVLFEASSDASCASLSRIQSRCFRLGEIKFAILACLNHHDIGEFALSKLWLELALKTRHGFRGFIKLGGNDECVWSDTEERRKRIRSELREIRNACGGCGSALKGERRQYCRGCRAYCYCSRECQKLHWSRADNGHREECKEVQEEARKIWQAIEDGTLRMPEVEK